MKLSPAQVQRFWREWSTTCQARNWNRAAGLTTTEIDVKRKELLQRCGFQSLTAVDRIDGFTKVLHTVIAERGDNLQSAKESDDASDNQARVLRHQICAELIPCLELYIENFPAYLTSIIEAKTRYRQVDRPTRPLTLLDLNAAQLKQVQYTLAARLNSKRKEAGDSIHDMKIKAHIPCDCAQCRRSEFVRQEVTAGEVPESDLEPF